MSIGMLAIVIIKPMSAAIGGIKLERSLSGLVRGHDDDNVGI
jgi:hypothetical protein